jgi:hypothetical protein
MIMNSKKLLLLVAIVLGYSSVCYGMTDEAVFQDEIRNREWGSIAIDILRAKTTEKLQLLITLLVQSPSDLNEIDHSSSNSPLILRLLVWYTDDDNGDQNRLNLRTALKELIKHNKVDADLKGHRVSVNDGRNQMALAMLQQVLQEIAGEKATTPKPAGDNNGINTVMQTKWLVFGSVALGVTFIMNPIIRTGS